MKMLYSKYEIGCKMCKITIIRENPEEEGVQYVERDEGGSLKTADKKNDILAEGVQIQSLAVDVPSGNLVFSGFQLCTYARYLCGICKV